MSSQASTVVFNLLPYTPREGEYGPFHRLQCPHINEVMCTSGRIGGDRSYGVGFRRVHAHRGRLPEHLGGIEFWTFVEPYRHSPPKLAYWNDGDPGVELLMLSDREIVAIPAVIVKRVDSYAYCRSCPNEAAD